jgi:hypothetical protein
MAEKINFICTVEELKDYAGTTRTFAVNISAGMSGDRSPATPLSQALLQPWLWNLQGVALYCQTDLTKPALHQPVNATLMLNPTLEAGALTALKTRLSTEFSATLAAASAQSPLFNWEPTDPGGIASPVLADAGNPQSKQQHPWPNVLAHASTFPAPLPQALNLVVFFQVAASDLTGTVNVVNMLVAPVFSVTVTDNSVTPAVTFTASYVAPTATPVAPPPPPAAPAPGSPQAPPEQGYTWSYAAATADPSGCLIDLHQQDLPIAAPAIPAPQPGTIDPNSPWILPEYEDGNEDWRTTLELRASESFDLARQMIGVLRDPYPDASQASGFKVPAAVDIFGAKPTLPQLDQLRLTILYLLRDTADFGLRYAPDGANTLRYVLERVASAQTAQSPGFDADTFASLAETALLGKESAYLAAPPPGDWLADLATVLGADTLALKTISATAAPGSQFPNPSLPSLLTALSDTQKTLAQDTTIAALLFTQWNRVLAADAQASITWNATAQGSTITFASQVQAELNALATAAGLRKRMLLANLGGSTANLTVWNASIAIQNTGLDDKTQIADNLACVLLASFYSRFGAALPAVVPGSFGTSTLPVLDFGQRTPSVAPPQPPLPSAVQTFLGLRLSESALAAKTIVVAAPSTAQPSPTAQPAVLRLHTTAQASAAKDDPLRGIAGVGMLLREYRAASAPQLPWSCLNVATLDVLDATQTPFEAEPVTFVPHRLSTRNGIQQTAISYDNRPLAAPSPATALSQYFNPNPDTPYFPLFDYRSIPQSPDRSNPAKLQSWARISGLKFGATYQALGFILRNSGALPKELANLTPPTSTSPPVAPLTPIAPNAFTAPAVAIPTFTYLRRAPVGPLRIKIIDGAQFKDFNQQSLPLIPDTVAPLAREAFLANASAGASAQLPLLMLWDSVNAANTGTYAFNLRPPSVDINVWDRWVAGRTDAANFPTTRAAVFTDFHLNAPKSLTDPSLGLTVADPGADISINDPSIIGYVCTLIPLYAPSTAKTGAPGNSPVFAPLSDLAALAPAAFATPGVGFAAVQGNQYSVTILKSPLLTDATTHQPLPGPFAGLSVSGTAIQVSIPAGEVWQLSIAPAIQSTDAAKFDAIATNNQFPPPATTPPVPVPLSSATPFELLIEYAQTATITPRALWQAMQFGFPNDLLPAGLTLSLAPAAGDDWHLVRRVQIARQVWRWMGRPIDLGAAPEFPSTAFPNLNQVTIDAQGNIGRSPALDQALNWELQAFAERDDDSTITQSRVFFPPPLAASPAPAAPPPQQIYRQDLSTDLRAHYFRFGARIYSRYEGLNGFQPFTRSQSVAAQISFNSPPANPADGYTTTARCFVPYRIAAGAVLPKPKILIVLPLTAPVPADSTAPPSTSILVIADEPWYQFGGLAEQLTATVESVILQRDSDELQMLQIGPDPILTAPNPQLPAPIPNTPPPALAPWIGTPIGTTFDDASTAPLLANTCFQFPLSQLATSTGLPLAQPLDWYMARLQFSRAIDPAMSQAMSQTTTSLSSPLTDGVWVQFLPSSSHFTDSASKSAVSISILTFRLSGQQLQLIKYDPNDKTPGNAPANITLQPGPAGGGQPTSPVNLQLWALLMRNITDAAGQPGEAYVGLYNLTAGAPPSNPIAAADHLYLLEVQNIPNPPASTTGWLDQIFPGAETIVNTTATSTEPSAATDVTHRLLRMSDRIKLAPG